jgi:type IV pilus assembly protein PilB
MLSPKVYLSALVEHGYLDAKTAERMELEALQSGREIEEIVMKANLAPKEVLLDAKARCLNVPYVNITGVAVNPQAILSLSKNLAMRYNVLPFKIDEASNTLYVATPDPMNLSLQNFLEQKTNHHVVFHLAYLEDVQKAIAVAYSQEFAPEVNQALKENNDLRSIKQQEQDAQAAKEKVENIAESPITKIVDTIMQYASQSRASDVHIEPQPTQTRVRYRIDGILQEKLILPKSIHESLVSRLKIMSGLKLDERRIPQDGRFSFKQDTTEIDVRVSTLPVTEGEKVVMRLLRKTGRLPTLQELGLRNTSLKSMQSAIAHPYGIILVTGPTGSGKTTTLYSVLDILNKPGVNILTLEDPVEYQMVGVNQVQINVQAGLTFATGLRAFLRQDPNIILVGEIRDSETVQLAVQAALTGHLVFSTLHTNNAATAIPRLIDLGAEPFLISSVLTASVAQRIGRKICPECKVPYTPPPEIQKQIADAVYGEGKIDPATIVLSKGTGCDKCDHTGYYGRIGIYEVLTVTPNINRLILQHATAAEIQDQAVSEGMITMQQDGYIKALAGETTVEEVLRLTKS